MVGQDTENEEGAKPGIRNDDIGQDGMGVAAAVTDDTHDPDFFPDEGPIPEFSNAPIVITMGMAFPLCTAIRTGILFREIFGHMGLEQLFW